MTEWLSTVCTPTFLCSWLLSPPTLSQQEYFGKWIRDLMSQRRELGKSLRIILKEEQKVRAELKAASKQRNNEAVMVHAKDIANMKKEKSRIHAADATIQGLQLELRQCSSANRMYKHFASTTTQIKSLNSLVSVPALRDSCTTMAKEMHKSGYIIEAIDGAVEEGTESEDEESVIKGILSEVLAAAPVAGGPLPEQNKDEYLIQQLESLNDNQAIAALET